MVQCEPGKLPKSSILSCQDPRFQELAQTLHRSERPEQEAIPVRAGWGAAHKRGVGKLLLWFLSTATLGLYLNYLILQVPSECLEYLGMGLTGSPRPHRQLSCLCRTVRHTGAAVVAMGVVASESVCTWVVVRITVPFWGP